MIESFRWLVSSENFMPHGHCFLWQPFTLWLNVGSDALIAASYLAIPVVIYYFLRHRQSEIRYAWVPMMFAAFILLCGSTHIMEIVTVWNPVYRVSGALKLVTGIVSFATLAMLIWIMPRALMLKTPGQLHAEVEARTRELSDINEELRAQIAARDAIAQRLALAEQDRARADVLLQTIVESAPTVIYAKDLEGRMLLANPPALKLIGKSWEEVKGRTDLEFLTDRTQAEVITRNDQRLMNANETVQYEEAVGNEAGADRVWFSIKAPLRNLDGSVRGLVGVSVDITEHKRLELRLRVMVHELNHRVKNTLATVQAIATQTLRVASVEIYRAFQERLLSLAAAHDVLTRESWSGANIHDVVESQLAPYAGSDTGRYALSGPKLRLSSKAALTLAMGLHELAVNAVKYGALSNDSGQILIRWDLTNDNAPLLRFTWTELGGPPVSPPLRRGFGSQLIERILTRDLGGGVQLQFGNPAGVTFEIVTLVSKISAPPMELAFPNLGTAFGASS